MDPLAAPTARADGPQDPEVTLGPPPSVWGPSLGINKHPIDRMSTILRQVQALVKIYNSKGSI